MEDQVNTKHQQIADVEDNHATSADLGYSKSLVTLRPAAKKGLGDLGVRNFDPSSFQLDTRILDQNRFPTDIAKRSAVQKQSWCHNSI
jgi:hypothetical protein